MITGTCIACGTSTLQEIATIEGYIQDNSYTVLACDFCGTSMATPHQSENRVYEWIYTHRRTAPGYARYAQFADEVLSVGNPLIYLSHREEMYYGVANEIKRTVPSGGKILDVGCGLGYFTYSLAQSGYDATGLDISEEAISNATKVYGNNFVCGDFFKHNPEVKYDAVCMLELIEHVDDPHAYITQAKTLLKPGGTLIVTTPNRSWFSDADVWNTDLPPVHLTWFSEKGVEALFTAHKLSPKFFDYARYNILYGTLCKPFTTSGVRTSIFSSEGNMLAVPYVKSHIRILTEKLHLYSLLKEILKVIGKIRECTLIILKPSQLSLRRASTICVSVKI